LLRTMGHGADEDLLRQVLGTIRIPDLPVQEPDDRSIRSLVEPFELVLHQDLPGRGWRINMETAATRATCTWEATVGVFRGQMRTRGANPVVWAASRSRAWVWPVDRPP